jgi:hypothetical protein
MAKLLSGTRIYGNASIDTNLYVTTSTYSVLGAAGFANAATVTTLSANGNVTASGLAVNNSATVGTTLGVTGNITTAGSIVVNSSGNVTAIVNGAASNVGNIGASGATFNTIFAKATTAQYADLAERYLSDADYAVGTVVSVGGEKEITASKSGDLAIGVISADPAFRMNEGLAGGIYVALKGRVPVFVHGPVQKGQRLVAFNDGTAMASTISTYDVFAVALETNLQEQVKLVEAVIL